MQKIFSYSLLLNNSEKPFDFKGFFRAFAAAGSDYIFRRLSVYTAGFPLGQAKSGTENGNPALVKDGRKKPLAEPFGQKCGGSEGLILTVLRGRQNIMSETFGKNGYIFVGVMDI